MMKRIGLTQRVDVISRYSERRDALDQRWAAFMERIGLCPVPLSNRLEHPEPYLKALRLDGAVLTGGNDLESVAAPGAAVPERDRFERNLVKHSLERRLPIVGVCRGAQMLNACFGGSVVLLEGHVRSRHVLQRLVGAADYSLAVDVNSFHAYGITQASLATGLKPLALAEDGSVEAFVDESGLCLGILWHPEREQPFGEADLKLFAQHLSL